jgi:hypothetical protein
MALFMAVVMVVSIVGCASEESRKYNEANDLMSQGDYKEALSLFQELGDYEDSADKVKEIEDIQKKIAIADKVVVFIDSIGDITEDNFNDKDILEKLETAESMYRALGVMEREYVTNYDKIDEANEKINGFQVSSVVQLINDIGDTPTEKKLTEAEKQYEELTDEQKALITNYDKLVKAREIYAEQQINELIKLIDSLSDDLKSNDKDIENLKKAEGIYKGLTDEQKELVTNYDKLVKARKTYDELLKEVARIADEFYAQYIDQLWFVVEEADGRWERNKFVITGVLRNDTNRDIPRATVTFSVVDINENKIGEATGTIRNWKKGGTWRYEAINFPPNSVDYVQFQTRPDVKAFER